VCPHEIILMLVDDRIEVAAPLLARSPLLSDTDLVHVVAEGSRDHQVHVAKRPGIGASVSEALVQTDLDVVLDALLRNTTAKIGEETFGSLVQRARESESLAQLLAERADLPPVLAHRMCEWVSGELKRMLTTRFPDE